ncbi:hypothetical protein O77CONTIG1_01891 [Leptolyngbya sp. O-77]|nr:hypothetical protein O77CONTIG1_01891 [Leptolyngbya sp. O-77]
MSFSMRGSTLLASDMGEPNGVIVTGRSRDLRHHEPQIQNRKSKIEKLAHQFKLNAVALAKVVGLVVGEVGIAEFQVIEIHRVLVEVGARVPGA